MKSYVENLGLRYPKKGNPTSGEIAKLKTSLESAELKYAIEAASESFVGTPIQQVRQIYRDLLTSPAPAMLKNDSRFVMLMAPALRMQEISENLDGKPGEEARSRTSEIMGHAWYAIGEHSFAANAYAKALKHDPTMASARAGHADALAYLGRSDLALREMEIALRQYDIHAACEQALLGGKSAWRDFNSRTDLLRRLPWMALHSAEATPESVRDYNARHAESFPRSPAIPFENDRRTNRRLNVGYLLGRYESDPLRYAIQSLLEHHNRFKVNTHAYIAGKQTAFQSCVTPNVTWQDVSRYNGSSDEIAETIREDQIDILVNACGYFGDPWTMQVCARKPAPIQVVYGTFPGSTGMKEMDYILADPIVIPKGAEGGYSEQVMRVKQFCTFSPEDWPAVKPPPMMEKGHVTFGVFHRLEKISEEVIALWARVLKAVPTARLRMQRKTNGRGLSPSNTEAFGKFFEKAGISPDRIDMHGGPQISKTQYLHDVSDVDIGLDTFPYGAHTVTTDHLLMGVPMITKRGDTYASNLSASLLTHAGFKEFVAEDDDEYVEKAVALASSRTRLRNLRSTMRDRVYVSPLCDGPGFASQVEQAYETMWRRWLSKNRKGP